MAVPEECAEEVEQKPRRSPSFKQPSACQLASRVVRLQPKWNTAYRLVAEMLESQVKDLEPEGIEVASKAGFTFLMNLVSEPARTGHRSLPNNLLLGLPIVGPAKVTLL